MPEPWIFAGAVLAGFVQGVSGFGFALVTAVFWSGHLPPQVIAPLVALSSVGGQVLTVRSMLPSLDLRRAAPMVAGGVVGVPIGVVLLPWVDEHLFRLGIGLLLCVYCPVLLGLRRMPRVHAGGRPADAVIGAIGGVMSGLAGLAGPVPILWCALRGWDKDTQRAMFQTFLIAVQVVSLVAYWLAGLMTASTLVLAAWLLPCALVPSWLGSRLYARLGGEVFRRMVLGLLLVTGVLLVCRLRASCDVAAPFHPGEAASWSCACRSPIYRERSARGS